MKKARVEALDREMKLEEDKLIAQGGSSTDHFILINLISIFSVLRKDQRSPLKRYTIHIQYSIKAHFTSSALKEISDQITHKNDDISLSKRSEIVIL